MTTHGLKLRTLSVVAVCAILTTAALGQSRKGSHISRVGEGSRFRKNPVREFQSYSFGVGNLAKPSTAGGGGVLRSSIYTGRSSSVRAPAGRGAGSPGAIRMAGGSRSRRVYQASSLSIPTVAPSTGSLGSLYIREMPMQTTSQVKALIEDLSEERQGVLADPNRPVTSLVPTTPGHYRDEMIKGEREFRKGMYQLAELHFTRAASLSEDVPGSLLALAHTYFAVAKGSYSQPSLYLRRTLKLVPELPLVNVRPISFYGRAEWYSRDVARLEEHVRANPNDPDALFVLGYLKWRDDKTAEADEALSSALTNADSEELKEAIQTLLDGMSASGKVRRIEGIEMGAPVEYPTAGLRFALPVGFANRPLRESSQVALAVRGEGTEAAQSFSAHAFPIGKGVTAKAFLKFVTESIQRKLAIRNLELVEEAGVSFHGIEGAAQLATYSHRGTESAAMVVCFVRQASRPSEPADSEPVYLAHLLVVETPKAQIDSVAPTLAKVLETVSLSELRRPIEMPMQDVGAPIENRSLGFAIRQPDGWIATSDETGLVMGRIDYLLGGIASPEARVLTATVADSWTSKSFGENAIKLKTEQGFEMEVLSQGPARLGGKDGYQFVIRKTALSAATEPAPEPGQIKPISLPSAPKPASSYIEIGRLICLPAEQDKKKLYALVLDCYYCEVEQAQEVMDKIASGFVLLKPPTRTDAPQSHGAE